MKKDDYKLFFVTFIILTIWLGGVTLGVSNLHKKIDQVPSPQVFDTSALENWCGDGQGIRMVGGWRYCAERPYILEDEFGHLYNVDVYVDDEDFCLLWIDKDNNVVKVWVEAHDGGNYGEAVFLGYNG